MTSSVELWIKPRRGWQPIDFRELWNFRELLGFLIWRDVKIRYKQTLLGGVWAVLQPLIAMFVFASLFTRVAPIRTFGVPYPLFVFAGLVPWTFFANALSLSSNSLIASEHLIRKIYLPRIFVPCASILALLLDVFISLGVMAVLLLCFHWHLSTNIFLLPLFLLGSFLATAGLGLSLSALNVHYRDVKYVVPFFTQMALFLTPVIYSLRSVPEKYRVLLALNPMAGMVEGFRYALLGSPAPWNLIWVSSAMAVILFVIGLFLFNRMERTFADVI